MERRVACVDLRSTGLKRSLPLGAQEYRGTLGYLNIVKTVTGERAYG